ncbi:MULTISPECIES: YnfA family protein [Azohydromonas]|jgi:hypothetical protein|uniref:Uncharacterized protein n=1 Tax=Azohydromonas lata TaxID=45677 RepID=A0ABU5ICL4_9BURK|nr:MULTISPECIES: hypothetical protein [Azohydromonas]MDZ5455703.1 hypothetical protein [Azohydromonas lata]
MQAGVQRAHVNLRRNAKRRARHPRCAGPTRQWPQPWSDHAQRFADRFSQVRVYAAYGGAYIDVALLWLWAVDQLRPPAWDGAGAAVALAGMG